MTKKISPAQAILKLIEYYQRPENLTASANTSLLNLYDLYLNGTYRPDRLTSLNDILALHKNDVLKPYQISFEPDVIDNDPTKRYFETHLAFATLKNVSKEMDSKKLEYLVSELKNMLLISNYTLYKKAKKVLKGKQADNTEVSKKTADYLNRIRDKKLFTVEQGFTTSDRKKIKSMIKISLLAIMCATYNKNLPLKVYGKDKSCFGFFGKEKGKILKAKDDTGHSQHYGLIKGHMPLSANDIAFSDSTFPFLKAAEQAKYDEKAIWLKKNFYHSVHPYSNSISGTLLCVIRILCYYQNIGIFTFTDTKKTFDDFIKLFSSTLLFFSGGHSMYEMISVLQLPEIINELQNKNKLDYLDLKNKQISSLYFYNNELAFKIALKKSIEYNNQYLGKCQLNEEIIKGVKLKPVNDLTMPNKGKGSASSSDSLLKKRKLPHNEKSIGVENKKLKR